MFVNVRWGACSPSHTSTHTKDCHSDFCARSITCDVSSVLQSECPRHRQGSPSGHRRGQLAAVTAAAVWAGRSCLAQVRLSSCSPAIIAYLCLSRLSQGHISFRTNLAMIVLGGVMIGWKCSISSADHVALASRSSPAGWLAGLFLTDRMTRQKFVPLDRRNGAASMPKSADIRSC